MKYQRDEGHNIAHDLRHLADEIEGCSGDLWELADDLDKYVIDSMDHDEYMQTKKALKKMIKMARKAMKAMPSRTTYYNEMEETNNDKT